MTLFGFGFPEILFILFLAMLIFGPKDFQKTSKTLGKWLNQLVHSEGWKMVRDTGKELQNLPTRLMRASNLEEHFQEIERDLTKTSAALERSSVPTDNRPLPPVDPHVPQNGNSQPPSRPAADGQPHA